MKHEIVKVRRDVVRRKLVVSAKELVTPKMLRIVFRCDELAGFESASPDDHIKIFLPMEGDGKPVMRDYTPRRWDFAAGTMTLEFALHERGAATQWARTAVVGDVLEMGGPRGSTVVPDDFDWYVMVGDAAALPSFGRRLGELRAGVPVYVFCLVAGEEERQTFASAANCSVTWLTSGTDVVAALEARSWPAGDGFVWVAAEAAVARGVYQYCTEKRGHPATWIKASAYWTEGESEG